MQVGEKDINKKLWRLKLTARIFSWTRGCSLTNVTEEKELSLPGNMPIV